MLYARENLVQMYHLKIEFLVFNYLEFEFLHIRIF